MEKIVTTFQNFGKLKLMISLPLTNPADSKAAYMIATGIIPNDGTIVGDLYDSGDNLIARKRVYAYSGKDKNIPFTDLADGQQGYLSGQVPTIEWDVETIKLWMDDRQAKDEDGKVSQDDPYYYKDDVIKDDLLSKILEK